MRGPSARACASVRSPRPSATRSRGRRRRTRRRRRRSVLRWHPPAWRRGGSARYSIAGGAKRHERRSPPAPPSTNGRPMSVVTLDVAAVRGRFLALRRPTAFLDGPGGTQVPDSVIDAVVRYLRESNANLGGPFAASVESDALVSRARATAARF